MSKLEYLRTHVASVMASRSETQSKYKVVRGQKYGANKTRVLRAAHR